MSAILLNDISFAGRYRLSPTNSFSLAARSGLQQGGGITEIGWTGYASKDYVAIILLKKVYNLGRSSFSDDIAGYDCPAGTVFLASKLTDLSINWPEPVDILIVHMGEHDLDRHDFYSVLTGNAGPSANLASFVCRHCLQIGQLIWSEFREEAHADDVYLAALYQALVLRLARGGDDLRARANAEEGLSSQASRQIEAYLKENFQGQISVPDMAALLGISSGHFTTCFKASFGLTPHQYVIKLRLDEAEACLRDTQIPIGEIAARLGFSSQSHLTTAFRKYRGLTPKEIRRRSGRPS
ncbi:helix-turn-helix domain-containing protein [Brucella anthropi]|uniref:helix-turn-helix domain-containing protein n=1 Tax=Brucella anthropi TaxID=529 RepID=UPI00398596CE